jgi:hypothetical protein
VQYIPPNRCVLSWDSTLTGNLDEPQPNLVRQSHGGRDGEWGGRSQDGDRALIRLGTDILESRVELFHICSGMGIYRCSSLGGRDASQKAYLYI